MKKALKYILIGLFLTLGIALVVLYIIFPADTKNNITFVWNLLNTPLPIIGVTTFAILMFAWQFFKNSQYGKKKIAEYQQELSKIKQEKEDFVNGANEKIHKLMEENKELKDIICGLCALSTNQKIKNFGKELEHGKETVDCETKAD